MSSSVHMAGKAGADVPRHPSGATESLDIGQAETVLLDLARVFADSPVQNSASFPASNESAKDAPGDSLEAKYRALLEQIPAVVFMAYLDRGIREAYVSPQIEAALGYPREDWLEDPVRWYQRIHPDDKQRWSVDAAEMFLSGKPLRSAYRVIARDGRTIWFRCDARMMRKEDGRPWFIHGVGFDISDIKHIEEELQKERNFVSAILDTVGALVVVLDDEGRILRFNPACELLTGYSAEEVRGRRVWDLFLLPEEVDRFKKIFGMLRSDLLPQDYQSHWLTRRGDPRLIAWTSTLLPSGNDSGNYIIATGIDITERKRLENAVLEISAREERRIGQDLHDGLGQHLTGVAFMAKVHEERLAEAASSETEDAAKLVKLVNEAIRKTRELARGLLPVVSDSRGLMSALQLWAAEVEDLFRISCRFQCESPVLIHDAIVATHLYHIAQEAVNNAIRHGDAREISIRLTASDSRGVLTIEDNGAGIRENATAGCGIGLHIMNYRAGMIGGSLEVRRPAARGTAVVCTFPIKECA